MADIPRTNKNKRTATWRNTKSQIACVRVNGQARTNTLDRLQPSQNQASTYHHHGRDLHIRSKFHFRLSEIYGMYLVAMARAQHRGLVEPFNAKKGMVWCYGNAAALLV